MQVSLLINKYTSNTNQAARPVVLGFRRETDPQLARVFSLPRKANFLVSVFIQSLSCYSVAYSCLPSAFHQEPKMSNTSTVNRNPLALFSFLYACRCYERWQCNLPQAPLSPSMPGRSLLLSERRVGHHVLVHADTTANNSKIRSRCSKGTLSSFSKRTSPLLCGSWSWKMVWVTNQVSTRQSEAQRLEQNTEFREDMTTFIRQQWTRTWIPQMSSRSMNTTVHPESRIQNIRRSQVWQCMLATPADTRGWGRGITRPRTAWAT